MSFIVHFPASFAPICFAIKSKDNDLLLEKNRVRLDDDSDEDGIKGEVQERTELAIGLVEGATREPPQPPLAEEKKPVLSQEELEAKQGTSKSSLKNSFTRNYTFCQHLLARLLIQTNQQQEEEKGRMK